MRLALLILSLCAASVCFSEEKKFDPPSLPENVTLANGAVLRDASVTRWEKDYVVIKHRGGTDPIRFAHMSPECRAAFEANRSVGLTAEASKKKAAAQARAAAPKGQTYKGEIFIVSQGRGTYRLSNSTVTAYPLASAESGLSMVPPSPPTALATTTTDSEGRFTLMVPFDELPIMIRVLESRMVGRLNEYYEWRISSDKIGDPGRVSLSNDNLFRLSTDSVIGRR